MCVAETVVHHSHVRNSNGAGGGRPGREGIGKAEVHGKCEWDKKKQQEISGIALATEITLVGALDTDFDQSAGQALTGSM